MTPDNGQNIVLYLRNGVQLEGVVVSWTDDKSVLQSPQGTSLIVIQKTLDDVMFFKITDARKDFQKLIEKPEKQEDDIKKIAELKNEINELDRVELRDKLSSHSADGMREIQYGLPGTNIKIKGAIKRPGDKIAGTNSTFGAELQDLFPKKH